MRKFILVSVIGALFFTTSCIYVSWEPPIVPNGVAYQQAPNVDNATKSAIYFQENIDEYLKDPQLVKDFADYNVVAWKGLNEIYNPSSTEVVSE